MAKWRASDKAVMQKSCMEDVTAVISPVDRETPLSWSATLILIGKKPELRLLQYL